MTELQNLVCNFYFRPEECIYSEWPTTPALGSWDRTIVVSSFTLEREKPEENRRNVTYSESDSTPNNQRNGPRVEARDESKAERMDGSDPYSGHIASGGIFNRN